MIFEYLLHKPFRILWGPPCNRFEFASRDFSCLFSFYLWVNWFNRKYRKRCTKQCNYSISDKNRKKWNFSSLNCFNYRNIDQWCYSNHQTTDSHQWSKVDLNIPLYYGSSGKCTFWYSQGQSGGKLGPKFMKYDSLIRDWNFTTPHI